MKYDYELVPLNNRKLMYDVYLLNDGQRHKQCMIMKMELKGILESQLDIDKLDAGQLKFVRLTERHLMNAAKQAY